MINLKATTDPLQGISKLNMLMIVSINQVILPSFIPTMIKGDEWYNLTPEKTALIYEYLEKQSDVTSLITKEDYAEPCSNDLF